MSGLTLKLRQTPEERIMASGLSANLLIGKTAREVASLPLSPSLPLSAKEAAPEGEMTIGDWFRVQGGGSGSEDQCVKIEGYFVFLALNIQRIRHQFVFVHHTGRQQAYFGSTTSPRAL